MNKVLVLGANSFAGSQFVLQALDDFERVIGINRSAEIAQIFLPYTKHRNANNYQFFQLDINNDLLTICNLLDHEKPSVIVDFAGQGMVAESWAHPEQWYQTNILAKVKLHDFLKGKIWLKRYVRVSTPEVYGSQGDLSKESFNYQPSTPYAVSHAAIDMSLRAFYRQYGFPVVFTRFSNFYGPGQQLYRIVPRAIIYALTGRTLELHGGGTSVRAFIYGEDAANALLAAIKLGKLGEVYHFSTSDFVSIRELIERIYKQLDVSFLDEVEIVADRAGKDANYLMDDSKAKTELLWQPQYSLDQGLSSSINWVKDNLSEITALPLNYQHKA